MTDVNNTEGRTYGDRETGMTQLEKGHHDERKEEEQAHEGRDERRDETLDGMTKHDGKARRRDQIRESER